MSEPLSRRDFLTKAVPVGIGAAAGILSGEALRVFFPGETPHPFVDKRTFESIITRDGRIHPSDFESNLLLLTQPSKKYSPTDPQSIADAVSHLTNLADQYLQTHPVQNAYGYLEGRALALSGVSFAQVLMRGGEAQHELLSNRFNMDSSHVHGLRVYRPKIETQLPNYEIHKSTAIMAGWVGNPDKLQTIGVAQLLNGKHFGTFVVPDGVTVALDTIDPGIPIKQTNVSGGSEDERILSSIARNRSDLMIFSDPTRVYFDTDTLRRDMQQRLDDKWPVDAVEHVYGPIFEGGQFSPGVWYARTGSHPWTVPLEFLVRLPRGYERKLHLYHEDKTPLDREEYMITPHLAYVCNGVYAELGEPDQDGNAGERIPVYVLTAAPKYSGVISVP